MRVANRPVVSRFLGMRKFLLFAAACLSLAAVRVRAEAVHFPGPGGIVLHGTLVLPDGPARPPAIVALHGCGGPFPARDRQWAELFAAQGHVVLFPDSFGSRGLGPQCTVKQRVAKSDGLRRLDAFAAAEWLASRPDVKGGGIALVGWSNGGATVLAAAGQAADQPNGLFTAFVAFYPGCTGISRLPEYEPSAPMLILVGERDDWTPIGPCRDLAGRWAGRIRLIGYPDSWHDFDAPGLPVRTHGGLPWAAGGVAHAGTNAAAREDALRQVTSFLAAHR